MGCRIYNEVCRASGYTWLILDWGMQSRTSPWTPCNPGAPSSTLACEILPVSTFCGLVLVPGSSLPVTFAKSAEDSFQLCFFALGQFGGHRAACSSLRFASQQVRRKQIRTHTPHTHTPNTHTQNTRPYQVRGLEFLCQHEQVAKP